MRDNKGVALFISLALLFLLSVGAIVVLSTGYSYTQVTENQINRLKALKSAEAGINYAYWKLRTDTDYASDHPDEAGADTVTPGSNGYSVKIWAEGPDSGRYTVKSKVSY
ncbi:MAG: hypothetical protein WC569_04510 [Candidatus Omnitrophota bacterium]